MTTRGVKRPGMPSGELESRAERKRKSAAYLAEQQRKSEAEWAEAAKDPAYQAAFAKYNEKTAAATHAKMVITITTANGDSATHTSIHARPPRHSAPAAIPAVAVPAAVMRPRARAASSRRRTPASKSSSSDDPGGDPDDDGDESDPHLSARLGRALSRSRGPPLNSMDLS